MPLPHEESLVPQALAPGPRCPVEPWSSTPLVITLPLEYTAFCLLHQELYLRYAEARIRNARISRSVVERALGELITLWPQVLQSCRPEAVAWEVLSRMVLEAARPGIAGVPAGDRDVVHRSLPAPQADAVLLCCGLSLDPEAAGGLMGVDGPAVSSQLRMARRQRPAALADAAALCR